jgi:hypothetical protein
MRHWVFAFDPNSRNLLKLLRKEIENLVVLTQHILRCFHSIAVITIPIPEKPIARYPQKSHP